MLEELNCRVEMVFTISAMAHVLPCDSLKTSIQTHRFCPSGPKTERTVACGPTMCVNSHLSVPAVSIH